MNKIYRTSKELQNAREDLRRNGLMIIKVVEKYDNEGSYYLAEIKKIDIY